MSELAPAQELPSLRAKLLEILNELPSAGSFAVSGTPPPGGWPGLDVTGAGFISLPVDETGAKKMIEQAHKAPFGKGSETLVDTSVRNTWELNTGQFQLKNPGWNNRVKTIANSVTREMNVDRPFSTQLYKLLIYEKGAMFKLHTDSEKAPGMFATLVIGLPSAHEGGEIVLTHCNKTKTIKISQDQISFAAWFADVRHEVLPVTSGYRCVLVYNMILDQLDQCDQAPRATIEGDKMLELRATLQQWVSQPSELRALDHFYFKLEHAYSQANILFSNLKGRDYNAVKALKEVTHDLPVHIFLAVLEKEQWGGCGFGYNDHGVHNMDFPIRTTYSIHKILDIDGRQVARKCNFDIGNVLQEDFFANIVPKEDFEPHANEGESATHWYRVTAVSVVPRDSLASFLMDRLSLNPRTKKKFSGKTVKSALEYLLKFLCTPEAEMPIYQLMSDVSKTRAVRKFDRGRLSTQLRDRLEEFTILNHFILLDNPQAN